MRRHSPPSPGRALVQAASQNCLSGIAQHFDCVDVHSPAVTEALTVSAAAGHTEVLLTLLLGGAHPDGAPTYDDEVPPALGVPLQTATAPCAQILLAAGANCDVQRLAPGWRRHVRAWRVISAAEHVAPTALCVEWNQPELLLRHLRRLWPAPPAVCRPLGCAVTRILHDRAARWTPWRHYCRPWSLRVAVLAAMLCLYRHRVPRIAAERVVSFMV